MYAQSWELLYCGYLDLNLNLLLLYRLFYLCLISIEVPIRYPVNSQSEARIFSVQPELGTLVLWISRWMIDLDHLFKFNLYEKTRMVKKLSNNLQIKSAYSGYQAQVIGIMSRPEKFALTVTTVNLIHALYILNSNTKKLLLDDSTI